MAPFNYTGTSHSVFILLGIPGLEEQHLWISLPFFISYLVALFGNITLILVIIAERSLHEPMYLFLAMLSTIDLVLSSVTMPKMASLFLTGIQEIEFNICLTQMFLIHALSAMESAVLLAMAFDRYVAICHPLRYPVLMNHRVCLLLMSVCWILGSLDGFMLTPVTMTFPFCGSREIHHFFCEVPAVTKLSCSDTWLYETLMYVCCVLMLLIPVTVISGSYTSILLTVLRMNSAEGRKKALATCSSHMTVVTLFYGAAVYTYMLPASLHTPEKDMVVSVFYTIVTPLLNPLIYSFRNKNVTEAMKKLLGENPSFQKQ